MNDLIEINLDIESLEDAVEQQIESSEDTSL
jgi:hypothetical protein